MSCENCVKGNLLPGEPEGELVGDAYFHAAPTAVDGAEGSSKKAIILLTDIFGLPLLNCKLNADRISKETGYDVWVPDLFAGSPPFGPDEMEPILSRKPGVAMALSSRLKFFWIILTRIPSFIGNRPTVVDVRVTDFITKLKAEKGYDKIGAIGYCFGGATCTRLGSKGLFDTVFIAHPGPHSIADIKAINIPAAWACAEEDQYFQPAHRNEAEAIFAARKDKPDFIDYEFKDYKGTVHGFAARPALEIPESVAGYEGAMAQAVAWFKKQLA